VKELDFEQIFKRHHQALYRFCFSIVGNAEDARDALQNTMVKALRSLPGEQREIQLKPWLYRVAHNESIELLRRRRDQIALDERLAASSTTEPGEAAAVRERLRTLLADLRELPERQRAALVMRELAGLDLAEIAEALETSPGVARQTVYEARLSLGQLQAGREMDCEKVRWELSGEDGRVRRRRDIQAHLRGCTECRTFRDAIANRRRDLAALAPLPAAASAGLLHAILAGGQSGGGGLGGAVGAGAGKVVAGSAAVKSAATVAVVVAIAVPAGDRAGLIDVGLFSRGTPQSQTAKPASTEGTTPTSGAAPDQRLTSGEAAKSQGRHARPALTEASVVGQRKSSNAAPTTSAPPAATTPSGAFGEPPAASDHGQETAALHGGGRDSAHSHSKSKAKGKAHAPASSKQPAHGSPPPRGDNPPKKEHPPHPATGQPPKIEPDRGSETPLQPSEPPKAQGPPAEHGGPRSKEAR
jgi:RNA polymerase sigma factor (sigma-70 family)